MCCLIPRLLVLGMRLACYLHICNCSPSPFLSVLQDHFLYLSVQDPHAPPPNGYNQEKSTSVWTNSGRHKASQLSPRSLQLSPRSLQLSPRSLQLSPRSLQLSPRSLQLSPRSLHHVIAYSLEHISYCSQTNHRSHAETRVAHLQCLLVILSLLPHLQ